MPSWDGASKSVTLVLGGARSGKSRYAQGLASRFQRVTFIATAQPSDGEMRKKIAVHRSERPEDWRTVEARLNLDKSIHSESKKCDVLLIDCFTLYVANLMYAKKHSGNPQAQIEAVYTAILASRAHIIAVSNEVGSGIVPVYRSGRIYRDLLGQMNQKVAHIANQVVLMIAGIPLVLKDSSPA